MLLLVGGWKRQHNKRNAGVLRSYRGSCLTASKEWGPESFNHMKLSCLLLLLLFCFFLAAVCGMQNFPDPGLSLWPLQWKRGILTGPPEVPEVFVCFLTLKCN